MRQIIFHVIFKKLVFSIGFFVSILAAAFNCEASSVRQVSVDNMLRNSQLIFEGKVTGIQPKENATGRIYTYISFTIIDTIKGEYQGNTIILRFTGGTIGNKTMMIGDMIMPQNGEHGIYFVESLAGHQTNPLYGWSQGHLIIRQDKNDIEIVQTNRKIPIIRLTTPEPLDTQEKTPTNNASPFVSSKGVASGLSLANSPTNDQGVTLNTFKNILRERMKRN